MNSAKVKKNRNCEIVIGCNDTGTVFRQRGLNNEVALQEQGLSRAQRDHEDSQIKLRNTTLLMDNVFQWVRRVAKSLSSFEEMDELEDPQDIVDFFRQLSQTVDRFLSWANDEYSSSKLSKLTSQACSKEYAEQHKLLNDKEFIRANCRIPASLDGQHAAAGKHKHGHHHGHGHHSHGHRGGNDDERHDAELAEERERLKHVSRSNVQEREQMKQRQVSNKGVRRSEHVEGRPSGRLEDEFGSVHGHGEESRSNTNSPRNKARASLMEKNSLHKPTSGRQPPKRPASGKTSEHQKVGSSGRPTSEHASRGRESLRNAASRDSSPG